MQYFTPSRLTVARERRGLTRVALAQKVGIAVRSVVAHENGETEPSEETIEAFARVLRFPRSFFFQPPVESLAVEGASFRSLARMTAAQRRMALAAGSLARQIGDWIETRFGLPEPAMPDLVDVTEPETAAAVVRQAWGLGVKAIPNMVHLLESKGVRVFSLAQDNVEVDAFSLWNGGQPFVFLNTMKSGERGRFDAAHELGHLLLHRRGLLDGRLAEDQADAFASAFLMPRETVIAHAPRQPTVDHVIALKKLWGVSAMSLAVRLHRVGMLSDWHYRSLCMQMSEAGYRKREPVGIRRETSRVLEKVFASLRETGVTKADVARGVHLHLVDVEALVFGLVVVPAAAGGRALRST